MGDPIPLEVMLEAVYECDYNTVYGTRPGIGASAWTLAEHLGVDEWRVRVKLSRLGRKGYIRGCTKLHCRCRCDVSLTLKGYAAIHRDPPSREIAHWLYRGT